ncbi:flavin reductase (DIM6/NTAB) family NADH-FMN oxidoreductase RutF [Pedobacter sp. UYEF25]
MQLNKQEIDTLERKYKLNLINSISGIKPANLIATKSLSGEDNVAIFSSVVHLGSSPAQLGFVMRPQNESESDTYLNIKETGFYTINHVSESFLKKAHYTSAKLDRVESEFDWMKIERAVIADFSAPFVAASSVKMGMKHLESINLPNGCIFIIGSVELLLAPDNCIDELGQLQLSDYSCVGVSGLNTYYKLEKLESFPYVRNHEIPHFE